MDRKTTTGAAAVAALGAAAAAGKVGWDRRSARQEQERERKYRLRKSETVPEGIRRIARGQVDLASDQLAPDADGDLGERVHESRKAFKRSRAVVRLVRDEIGDDAYRRENTAYRDAGRRLSAARDAQVLVETLDALVERYEDEVPPDRFARFRELLAEEHREATERLHSETGREALEEVNADLERARDRLATWSLDRDDYGAVQPGLQRIYRRGRRAFAAASDEPTVENFHEWRKRVKDLWHANQVLRKRKRARRLHHLSNLLGDDHDLAVLREKALASHRCFEPRETLTTLKGLIDRRRSELESEALELGARLYRRKPRAYARRTAPAGA
jgi:hypothetical protein